MSNGSAAHTGEILDIPFSCPYNRHRIMEDPEYYNLRNYGLNFLYRLFARIDE